MTDNDVRIIRIRLLYYLTCLFVYSTENIVSLLQASIAGSWLVMVVYIKSLLAEFQAPVTVNKLHTAAAAQCCQCQLQCLSKQVATYPPTVCNQSKYHRHYHYQPTQPLYAQVTHASVPIHISPALSKPHICSHCSNSLFPRRLIFHCCWTASLEKILSLHLHDSAHYKYNYLCCVYMSNKIISKIFQRLISAHGYLMSLK